MTAYNDDVHLEYVAATHDNYTSRKNDPAVRRLLQTLAAANVKQHEIEAIQRILEYDLPYGVDVDARGKAVLKILVGCEGCNKDWVSALHMRRICPDCAEARYEHRQNALHAAARIRARRSWIAKFIDDFKEHVKWLSS